MYVTQYDNSVSQNNFIQCFIQGKVFILIAMYIYVLKFTSWQKILLIFFFKIWNIIFIYKKNLISFNSTRKQVLEAISPYFALDYLLPRTFVASLNLTYLANIDLSLIPPEVTLAATYFYIKTSYVVTRDMITVCLKSLVLKWNKQWLIKH
jgi:hypothetical protein